MMQRVKKKPFDAPSVSTRRCSKPDRKSKKAGGGSDEVFEQAPLDEACLSTCSLIPFVLHAHVMQLMLQPNPKSACAGPIPYPLA